MVDWFRTEGPVYRERTARQLEPMSTLRSRLFSEVTMRNHTVAAGLIISLIAIPMLAIGQEQEAPGRDQAHH